MATPCFLSVSLSNQGSFPPPALPGLCGNTSPSVTLPAQPAPRGGPVGPCHATGRASRVATLPLFHACRRQYPGGTGRCPRRSLPGRWQPSPKPGRVGFRVTCFEACSAFTCVAARMVAEPPKAALLSECFRRRRYLHHPLRLLPAGATVAGRDSHPLREGAFPRRTQSAVLTGDQGEQRFVWAFVSQAAIEAFNKGILGRLAQPFQQRERAMRNSGTSRPYRNSPQFTPPYTITLTRTVTFNRRDIYKNNHAAALAEWHQIAAQQCCCLVIFNRLENFCVAASGIGRFL